MRGSDAQLRAPGATMIRLETRTMEPFLQAQLAETQWWKKDELVRNQFNQIKILIDHAARTIPYWQARFAAAGIAGSEGLETRKKFVAPTRAIGVRSFTGLVENFG